MKKKTVLTSGADETTPSHPQYFSWINNTNEGATEAQTLINIDFFDFMRREYGMQLEIYAWDAGNLDGSSGTYADFSTGKLQKQYPNGYGPCAEAAKKAGFRMGVWGGADGYGNTKEEEEARHELIVSLCRDYNFALFKFDTVCGSLRPEKREAFARTINDCRKYSPDLVLLNHRNDLGEAEILATTFLWGGVETYVDVHLANPITAMHHRGFVFTRGQVPGLQRLTEDHGVCISSCIDYFEDDLIYQAFSRSLILAPEIYGNPWLMRDDELPVLANIYNLHGRYRDILVNGFVLPDFHGASTVSRGDGQRRFITTGNQTWSKQKYCITLDSSVGLDTCENVTVIQHHPTTKFIGEFKYGDTVEIEINPFRAALIEVCDSAVCDIFAKDCEYEVLSYTDGKPDKIKIIKSDGIVKLTDGKCIYSGNAFDNTEKAPIFLKKADECAVPSDSAALYEATCFSIDNDTLEKRELKRSGETSIPEVKAAREAFFNQRTYILRGSDSEFLFDNNPDTFYDGRSKTYSGGLRIDGGCLRVDLGKVIDCDTVEIEYYSTVECSTEQILPQSAEDNTEISRDLRNWDKAPLITINKGTEYTMEYVRASVHDILCDHGIRETAVYKASPMRYFKLPCPIDRIFSFRIMKNGIDVTPDGAKANNLMADSRKKQTVYARKAVIRPENTGRLAVAVNGVHGDEGVYCAARLGDRMYGFTDRAPSYPSNVWEHLVRLSDRNTTHFLTITDEMVGKELEIFALFTAEFDGEIDIYSCPEHTERHGAEVKL